MKISNKINLIELKENEMKSTVGGAFWKPFIVAGYAAYVIYNETVDFIDDFKKGYNENIR